MNWTSGELKKKGLESLKDNFARAYLVVLMLHMIIDFPSYVLSADDLISDLPPVSFMLMLTAFLTAAVLLAAPLHVGGNVFFLEQRKQKADYCLLWRYFTEGTDKYLSVVKGMFFRYFTVFVKLLIFIAPGVTGYYSTFFVPWILAEYPEMSPRGAVERSKAMTSGQRMNIFIMQMTFAGWIILSIFLVYRFSLVLPPAWARIVSIAVYALPFVYYRAAVAELYVTLSEIFDKDKDGSK